MGGVLTHVITGVLLGLFLVHVWKKWEFFWAALLGSGVVDFFKFFGAAVNQRTLSVFHVQHDHVFRFFSALTNDWANWLSLAFFLTALVGFLYHHHYLRKKQMKEYDELIWAFFAGVFLHLFLDLFIIENSPWI